MDDEGGGDWREQECMHRLERGGVGGKEGRRVEEWMMLEGGGLEGTRVEALIGERRGWREGGWRNR